MAALIQISNQEGAREEQPTLSVPAPGPNFRVSATRRTHSPNVGGSSFGSCGFQLGEWVQSVARRLQTPHNAKLLTILLRPKTVRTTCQACPTTTPHQGTNRHAIPGVERCRI